MTTLPSKFRLAQSMALASAAILTTACGSGGGGSTPTSSSLSSVSEQSSSAVVVQSSTSSDSSVVESSVSSAAESSMEGLSSSSLASNGSGLVGTGDPIKVDVNLDLVHSVGDVSEFDRRKFITIHAAHNEPDWEDGATQAHSNGAKNALGNNLATSFANDLDVYFGRNTGNMAFVLRNVVEDPNRSGRVLRAPVDGSERGQTFHDLSMSALGGDTRYRYTTAADKTISALSSRDTDSIIAAQSHPYWPGGESDPKSVIRHRSGDSNLNWSFSTADTASEPFGAAVGEFMASFLASLFNQGEADVVLPSQANMLAIEGQPWGAPKPKYLELMNEPLFDLIDGPVNFQRVPANAVPTVQKIFDYHKGAAIEFRKNPANSDVMIGGYTTAFPNYEVNNFKEWEERDQLFIDTAGEQMDFFSIHLYDFPNFNRSEQYRKGSNMEATLDMLERYSMQKLGEIKPWVISEYGSQLHGDFCQPWSSERDWRMIKAINSMMISFMERPNVIAKTVPFIVAKAEWGRNTKNNTCPKFADGESVPYYWRLMRQADEPASSTGEWIYADTVKFYELWSDVKGTRIDSWSQDLDILVDAYVDDKIAYVIVNSLEFENKTLDLSFLGDNGNTVNTVEIKHLYLNGTERDGTVTLTEEAFTTLPDTFVLGTEATAIIKVTYDNTIEMNGTSQEIKHYAPVSKQPIQANVEQSYRVSLDGFTPGGEGEAILRLGVGRDHTLAVMPSSIVLNGKTVAISSDFDYRGYDQSKGGTLFPSKGRDTFFGVLEIPVNYADLAASNDIKITFEQAGGHVSSVALQVFNMSREVIRTN